ncbi:hypothetical protein [Paenibacillus sp. 32O-W]|uniref:hypothetical protein n=1 Tax=Paenibacillus sp. 32O-W TaxID=1695218 RepID=UPI0011A9CCB8|nr:hypothetical protein [Paenibacillus sp. 32O-W]
MQLELFPKATAQEIQKAKQLLEEYEKCLAIRASFERDGIEQLSEAERVSYQKCIDKIKKIERSVKSILDQEVKEIIDYRYIQCHNYTSTVYHFSKKMDDRTVDRKLNKGIESIAETLKLF